MDLKVQIAHILLGLALGWAAKALHVKAAQTAPVDKALGEPAGTTAEQINAVEGALLQKAADKL